MFTLIKFVALFASALSAMAMPTPKVAALAAFTGEGVWSPPPLMSVSNVSVFQEPSTPPALAPAVFPTAIVRTSPLSPPSSLIPSREFTGDQIPRRTSR